MRTVIHFSFLVSLCAALVAPASGGDALYSVGMGKLDVTPDYPVRLAGYAMRSSESEGIAQRIWAKAIAIGADNENPAILITVDNCGVPINVRNIVVAELRARRKIDPARVTICSSHTHSAPLLHGYLTNLFLGPLPPEQDAHIKRYTEELTQALIKVACLALDDRGLARLSHDKGSASFAGNRRTKGGPVDHDVPALFIRDPDGKLRAVFASYACHCTTVTGQFNQICGDWAGYAQAQVENENPGAICLVSIGCGGDANPDPRPGFDLAKQHGDQIAKAVREMLKRKGTEVLGTLAIRTNLLQLPYDTLPTRAEWEDKVKEGGYVEQHARINLARLDRGEKLPTHLPYMLQSWTFGDSFLMVFLPGEVTVDYSLRLKKELDATRLWVNAYANDVPCYIPSERVLKEGGYEGGFSMVYYDRPVRFAVGVEDIIINGVRKISPGSFTKPEVNK